MFTIMLEVKKRIPMFCPVGLEFDRVVAGIHLYPVNFIHIIHSYPSDGEKTAAVDKEAQSFAAKIDDNPYFRPQKHPTNILDLTECTYPTNSPTTAAINFSPSVCDCFSFDSRSSQSAMSWSTLATMRRCSSSGGKANGIEFIFV